MTKRKKHKIVILAGGGLFGYVATYLLSHIKEDFVTKIDTISGTSIGGILALIYAVCPDRKYINDQFKLGGKQIFTRSFLDKLKLSGPKYSNKNLLKFIKVFLQDYTLADLYQVNQRHLNVIIPTIDYNLSQPKIFDNICELDLDMPLWQLALATSAAPTYFPAIQYKDTVLIDGGVLENIPITSTITALMSRCDIRMEDMDIFVIGTGIDVEEKKLTAEQVTNFNYINWLFDFLIPYVTESNEMASMYWWQQKGIHVNSIRVFNPVKISGAMDDPAVLNYVESWCEPYVEQFKSEFMEFLNK